MKKALSILSVLLCLFIASCDKDEEILYGELVLNPRIETSTENVDFSNYEFLVQSPAGWGISKKMSEMSWPLEIEAGGPYTVLLYNPEEDSETPGYHYAAKQECEIMPGQTTTVNLSLTLQTDDQIFDGLRK